jgi:hypothetical protein
MGAADLSQIRWSPDRTSTLGRGLDASWFAQMPRAGACEGKSGGESPRDGPGMMCFEGGSAALEPRPWDQGGQAQVSSSRRSFRPRIPQSSRLQSTADGRTQRVRQRITALPPERAA